MPWHWVRRRRDREADAEARTRRSDAALAAATALEAALSTALARLEHTAATQFDPDHDRPAP